MTRLGMLLLATTVFIIAACGSEADADISSPPATAVQTTSAPPTTSTVAPTTTEPTVTPATSPATTIAEPSSRCDGGAWPNDPDFRVLVCNVQLLQLEFAAARFPLEPDWVSHSTHAILTYGQNRAASVSELESVIADMTEVLKGR